MPDDPAALKIVGFRIGAKHTVNLGNYNNIQIEAALDIVVQEGADLADLRDKAQTMLRSFLEETYKRQRMQRNGQQQGGNGH